MARRLRAGQSGREGEYLAGAEDEPVPPPVLGWQREVHRPGLYDLEVDTSVMTPLQCAEAIRQRLGRGLEDATAFRQLAAMAS